MLIACPECEQKVSDRAAACPSCAFPIAADLAEQRAAKEAEEERTQRKATDAWTDCAHCGGRGFAMEETGEQHENGLPKQVFWWCNKCARNGRLPVAHSPGGYFAVAIDQLDAFVAGDLEQSSEDVFPMGEKLPPPPSYGPDGTLSTKL